jgi:hypothetical protein
MARPQEEIKRQIKYARWLFIILFVLLIGFVLGVMVFQFGWWHMVPANGTLYPPPTATPTATPTVAPTVGTTVGATATPALVTGGAGNTTSGLDSDKDEITAASVGSTYWTWLFASWAGVTVFLLSMAARRFYKIWDGPDSDFIRYLPWYLINFFRAPLLAMIVLWIFTNINITLGTEGSAGLAVDFKALPPIVMISIAFILGHYARVSQKQLDLITKSIFPKAWLMAEDMFEVIGPETLLLKGNYNFRTDPASDVLWTASLGEIDPETGVYKAPVHKDFAEKTVIVRASARSDPSRTNHKAVTLKLIQINGPAEAKSGEGNALSITTNFTDELTDDILKKVDWSSNEGSFDPSKGKATTFTVTVNPPKENIKKAQHATVKATLKPDDKSPTYTAEISIPLTSK